MNDKKRQLLEVSIEDFDIALLRQAAREGRLFIAPEGSASGKQTPDNRQQLVASILTYVQPIAEYSTCPRVGEIWEAVLNDDRLAPLFFFSRYSRSRGKVNWYRVTALMCLLHEFGIYDKDIPSQRLHCILEGTQKRTNRYTGMNRYLFEVAQIRVLREILNKFKQ